MFTFLMNITYLVNYINHPNFSILSVSNNSIKGNIKFFLYKQWRHTWREELQLHSFLTLAIDEGEQSVSHTGGHIEY